MQKKATLIIVILALAVVGAFYWYEDEIKGYPPPWQDVAQQKVGLIRLKTPLPNDIISSPLTITGEARGYWYFEASFPIFLVDWDGKIIAQGIAQAKDNWMTEEFVPFEATLTFAPDPNAYSNRGALILKKDNPSGLPEHDDALEIPVLFVQ